MAHNYAENAVMSVLYVIGGALSLGLLVYLLFALLKPEALS